MLTANTKRQFYGSLGSLLQYPTVSTEGECAGLIGRLEDVSAQAGAYLREFLQRIQAMTLAERQEQYVSTFDLLAQCSLYVSVYLFGEESFKRAELMAGLKRVYDSHGVVGATELPDHLAVVLKHNDLFSDEEWHELVAMAVLPAIIKMTANLEKRDNPYALVLKAVHSILTEREKAHV